MQKKLYAQLMAEFLGTFFIVFIGCGSVIQTRLLSLESALLIVALVFGAVVTTLIYTFGNISGAFFNPAVTIAFYVLGKINLKEGLLYIVFQVLGATCASYGLYNLWPELGDYAGTSFNISLPAGLMVEFLITFLLMLVVSGAGLDPRSEKAHFMAPMAIGFVVFICVIVTGPLTGCSMNPARSFGPAFVTGEFGNLWAYWLAPTAGCVSGALVYRFIQKHA